MPREDRRLIFDYAETYKAIYALCDQKELKKPPAGEITAVDELATDDTQFNFKIENNLDNSLVDIAYSRDFLAAALMLYCRSCNIPLPKKGRKSVLLQTKSVILRVQL